MSVSPAVRAKTFIDNLAHTPSDQVKPRKISNFIKALDLVFTPETTKATMAYVFSDA